MRSGHARLAAAPALLALLASMGCSPVYGDAYLAAVAAGARAYHAGRYLEAASAYDGAAAKALRVKDRDEARLQQARSFERAERWPEALAAYHRLIVDSPAGPRTARAEFDIAEIEIDHGNIPRGWSLLEQAARRNPNHGLARPSILRVVAHVAEQDGEPAAIAWLEGQAAAFRGTDQAQTIEYEIGLALERMDKKAEAHDAFTATAHAHPYPFGGLTDDALVRAAKIDVDRGRYEEATRHLRELLATVEDSHTMGSYERPRYAEAQLMLGEIYRDKLKDHATARREFEKVYREHPTSIKADDALWAQAKLAREDGDAAEACRLAKKLVVERGESRFASCARLVCPTAPAPRRACADYIERETQPPSPAPPSP